MSSASKRPNFFKCCRILPFTKTGAKIGVKLVDIIKNNNKFKIHTNGEISIQNQKLKNSNINDLIADVLRDRKGDEILHHGKNLFVFYVK